MRTILKALRKFYLILLIATFSCQTTVFAAEPQGAGVGLSGPIVAVIAPGGVILVGAIIAIAVALIRRNR